MTTLIDNIFTAQNALHAAEKQAEALMKMDEECLFLKLSDAIDFVQATISQDISPVYDYVYRKAGRDAQPHQWTLLTANGKKCRYQVAYIRKLVTQALSA